MLDPIPVCPVFEIFTRPNTIVTTLLDDQCNSEHTQGTEPRKHSENMQRTSTSLAKYTQVPRRARQATYDYDSKTLLVTRGLFLCFALLT